MVGVARLEFCKAITTKFNDYEYAWEHTVAVIREAGKVVACVWNEGEYDGSVFFLYDKQERAEDLDLMEMMMKFAKTYAAGLKEDGNTTPAFFLSNVHMLSFNYGKGDRAADKGVEGFKQLREMEDYKKELELCIVDPDGMPVAFTMVWYHEGMAFCEMEPLAVAWWERRKGLGTAIIHEAANRIKKLYPECTGMRAGDQEFYKCIGFERKGKAAAYYWEKEIFISWDERSRNQNYKDVTKVRLIVKCKMKYSGKE